MAGFVASTVILLECLSINRLGGEIGRHKRLKISRQKWRTGSIPVPGTIYT